MTVEVTDQSYKVRDASKYFKTFVTNSIGSFEKNYLFISSDTPTKEGFVDTRMQRLSKTLTRLWNFFSQGYEYN